MIMTDQEILSSLDYQVKRYDYLKTLRKDLNNQNGNISMQIQSKEMAIKVIEMSREYYRKAIDILYERSVGELKSSLNYAVKYIFFDKNYEIDIVLSDKRGKSLTFVLIDKDTDNEVNLKDGTGNGVRSVISAVIHMYYLIQKKSPFLFVDESYSFISDNYIDRFFEFLKGLCYNNNFIMVLITHDRRFLDYADKIYQINNGRVKIDNIIKVKENDSDK
jgi:DNA repair exonuclease SbcCD ATPase subunit